MKNVASFDARLGRQNDERLGKSKDRMAIGVSDNHLQLSSV